VASVLPPAGKAHEGCGCQSLAATCPGSRRGRPVDAPAGLYEDIP